MLSEFDKRNIGNILIGDGDYFTAHLLRLIAKADNTNRTLLKLSFPKEVELVENYLYGTK